MERWDISEQHKINADLGQKRLQLLGMHTIHSVVVTHFPTLTVQKVISLNTMLYGNYQGFITLGDFGSTLPGLMNAAMPFFMRCIIQSATRNNHGICSRQCVHK